MYLRPFEAQGGTVNATVTASSAVLQVNAVPIGNRTIRIANVGTQTIFVVLGNSASTASVSTSMPIQAGSVETFFIRNEITHVAHIASSTGSTIYVTIGEGA